MATFSVRLGFIYCTFFHIVFGDIKCNQAVSINGNGTVIYPTNPVVGSVLKYICPHGFWPYPVSWRVCLKDGQWSPLQNSFFEKAVTAVCRPYTCIGYITLENGMVYPRKLRYRVGDTVHFECDDGYRLFGSPNRTCQPNGEWSGSITICDDAESFCPNPGIPLGGQRTGRTFRQWNTVRYTCAAEFILRGSHMRHCMSNGRWSGQEPRCEAKYSSDDPLLIAQKLRFSEEIISYIQEGIHIYFVLDASGSVGQENFEKTKDFIFKLIIMNSAVLNTVKYGIVVYASNPLVVTDLKEKDEAIESLDNTEYTQFFNQSGTNTGAALQKILESVVKNGHNRSKQIILLITDGKYNMGPNPYTVVKNIEKAVQDYEEMLDIFTIGIGDADKEDMEKLSSKKEEQRSFYLASYDLLENITNLMEENTNKDACGIRGPPTVSDNMVGGRVFKGTKSKPKQWPWQVLLFMKQGTDWIGGGSLISKRWVVTAAHNVYGGYEVLHPDNVNVFIGTIKRFKNHSTDVPSHPVENIIVHEMYKPESEHYNYDIALLKLKNEVEFNEKVRPICLPCSTEVTTFLSLPQGTWNETCDYQDQILTGNGGQDGKQIKGFIAGWGLTKVKRTKIDRIREPENLIHAVVEIQDRSDCDYLDHKFCATGNGTDACQGDSGGPFMVRIHDRWIQVGLISHAKAQTKCAGTTSGVYISITKMMSWIKSKISDI